MNNVKKQIKFYGFVLGSIFISLFLVTLLYYFNILGNGFVNYTKYIILLLVMFVSGYKIGKRATKNGWLEGLKFGLILVLFFFIFSFLAFNEALRLRIIIYYIILLFTSILGSMIGINKINKK